MNISQGYLADYFSGFGFKKLSSVEIDPTASNEHEFNGVASFRSLFGSDRRYFKSKVIYLSDNSDDICEDEVTLTWYNARESHPIRNEYRLYYTSSICFDKASVDDLMIICRNRHDVDNQCTLFISKSNHTITNQLMWLLGIENDDITCRFKAHAVNQSRELNYLSTMILEKVGIEVAFTDENLLEELLRKYPNSFPKTIEFSAFAQSKIDNALPIGNPDNALIECLNIEEHFFRLLEHHFVETRLRDGFSHVDQFIEYSKSILNRRKSRAGRALENHLRWIFDANDVRYSYNKVTEHKSRPDFIFPDIDCYHSEDYPSELLCMLGVKTTCKDRWRQVLSEAARIHNKHLCTLEPAISENQTFEMYSNGLKLVIPETIIDTFNDNQKGGIMTIREFIEHVKSHQIIFNG